MRHAPRPPEEKIHDRPDLLERYGRPRDGRLVFTNGCFDVLHRGHVMLLAAARARGDALVVGLNTDASVHRLKGPGRPLVGERDRALVLAALESVDAVTLFDEDTPLELIRALEPDVLVKGADYRPETITGRAEVEDAGGEVVVVPLVEGYSSSALIERMRG